MKHLTLKRLIAMIMAGTMLLPTSTFAATDNIAKASSFEGAYLAGRIAGSDGHIDLAIEYFKQALSYQPNNPQMLQDMLFSLLSIGDFKQAIPIAKKLKTGSNVDRFVRLTLATDAFKNNKFNDVKTLLKLNENTDMDKLVTGLLSAWATYGNGNKNLAITQLKNIIGPAWYDIFTNYQLALMSELSGKKQDAEKYYNQAINDQQGGVSAPDTYERVIISYASFQLRNNKRKEALILLSNGEKLLSGRDALKSIRQDVEKGGTIAPFVKTPRDGASEVFYDIGTAINHNRAETFARIILQMSLELNPHNDATIFQLAATSSKLQQFDKAIEFYKKIPKNSSYYRDGELRLAVSLSSAKKNDEAIEHLMALEKQYPDDRRISMSLAGIYMQEKNYTAATEVMNRAISYVKSPQRADWIMFYQRGTAFEALKNWSKAEPDLRKALELFPNQPQVLNYLGYSLIDRNIKLDEALNMVKKAAEQAPDDGYIVDSLGWAYYKLGRYQDAVNVLENAVKMRPEDATINDHLGDAYWQVGRKLEATFQWQHALAAKPENDEIKKIEDKLKVGLKPNEATQPTKLDSNKTESK